MKATMYALVPVALIVMGFLAMWLLSQPGHARESSIVPMYMSTLVDVQ